MADQGSIGVYRTLDYPRPLDIPQAGAGQPATPRHAEFIVRTLPVWIGGDSTNWHKLNVDQAISGTVTKSGTPRAGVLVRLYERVSGVMAGAALTGANGMYSFAGLSSADRYFVVAFESGVRVTPDSNAAVADNLTPA